MQTLHHARRRVRRVVRRTRVVGADVFDAGRRTYGFARRVNKVPNSGGAFRRAGLVAAAAGDELLLATFRQLHAPVDPDAFATTLAEARGLVAYFEEQDIFDNPSRFHLAPLVPELEETSRQVGRVHFGHATFASSYRPGPDVPGALRYAEHTLNDTAHAWMLRQDETAPWVVCVHGAGMGDPLADLFAFRAGALHRAGFNVAIPVLPHHGPRGAGRFQLAFPSDDPTINLHGAAQAIADVRALLAYVAARGEAAVLHGISLGAYVAAAVGALEPSLAGVIVGVPVVDIPDLLRTHAPPRFVRHPRFAELHDIAQRLDSVTSPLALGRPAAPIRRVWAGSADRLVRPRQVARLVAHWGLEDAAWYVGGHVGFMTAGKVRRYVDEALVDAGVASLGAAGLVAVA